MQQEFKCYANGDGTEWQALCVDLDIATQGASFEEVRDSLATAIDMYLQTVAELPAEERTAFLSRRSPWRVRVGLAIRAWLHGLVDRQQPRGFALRPRISTPA